MRFRVGGVGGALGEVKPPFAYYGGKMMLADRIVALMPDHRVYLEPFFGSGAVLFAKPPSSIEVVNDLNDMLVTFWRVLRERPDELRAVCALTPHSRVEYQRSCDDCDLGEVDDLEVARRWWVRVNQGFAKSGAANSGWSVTTARSHSIPSTIMSRLGRFGPAVERLANVSIESGDAVDLIERLATDDTLIYLDPPYAAETRVGRKHLSDGSRSDYVCDMMGEAEHRRLGEVVNATSAKVVLSGYPSAMYDEMFADWNQTRFDVTSFSSNARTSKRGSRVEVCWTNFDPPAQMSFDLLGQPA